MDSRLAPWSKLGAEYQRRFVRVDVLAQELGMSVETVVHAARKSPSCCMTHTFRNHVTHVADNPDGAGFRPNAPANSVDSYGPPLAQTTGKRRKKATTIYDESETTSSTHRKKRVLQPSNNDENCPPTESVELKKQLNLVAGRSTTSAEGAREKEAIFKDHRPLSSSPRSAEQLSS